MKVVALLLVCFSAAFAVESYEKSCEGPADPGMCQAYIPMYYYDTITRTCEKFIYGGCQGNGNRYRTKEECLDYCTRGGIRPKVDVCSLEADAGPCRAYVPSYFYNYRTGKCEKFVYGGCQGNENRFATQEDCYAKCGLNIRPEIDDVCSLESDSGPCYGNFPMYYYNSRTGECQRFIYGGCQGNENRFRTKEECYGRCGTRRPYSAPNTNFCTLKPETGPCRAAFRKYYYNAETGTCEKFIYGGCAGNDNRFNTKEECYSSCGNKRVEDVCTLKPETGHCKAYFLKYFYNSETGECKQFVYGGCQGNGNRFNTKEECHSRCSPRSKADEDTCSLEPETGMCRGYFPRYYFNKNTGVCEEFIYGGCDGNSNNFKTYEDCADACGAP